MNKNKNKNTDEFFSIIEVVPFDSIKINPTLNNFLPPNSKKQKDGLLESIKKNGLTEPLIVREDTMELVDGHHRLSVCDELDKMIPVIKIKLKSDEEAKKFMLNRQVNRRNSNVFQRVVAALELEKFSIERGKKNMGKHGLSDKDEKINSRQIIADMAGTSPANVGKIKQILKYDNKEMIHKVGADELSIHRACELIKKEIKKIQSKKHAKNNTATDIKDTTDIEALNTPIPNRQDDKDIKNLKNNSDFINTTNTEDEADDCGNNTALQKNVEDDYRKFTTVYIKADPKKNGIQGGDWISAMPQDHSFTALIEARADNLDDIFRFLMLHDLTYCWTYFHETVSNTDGGFLIIARSDNKISEFDYPMISKFVSDKTEMDIPNFIREHLVNETTGKTIILNSKDQHNDFYTWDHEKGIIPPNASNNVLDEPIITPELIVSEYAEVNAGQNTDKSLSVSPNHSQTSEAKKSIKSNTAISEDKTAKETSTTSANRVFQSDDDYSWDEVIDNNDK